MRQLAARIIHDVMYDALMAFSPGNKSDIAELAHSYIGLSGLMFDEQKRSTRAT